MHNVDALARTRVWSLWPQRPDDGLYHLGGQAQHGVQEYGGGDSHQEGQPEGEVAPRTHGTNLYF